MAMSRAEVMEQYETAEKGGDPDGAIITSHGKFEREPIYVPALWESTMEGGADDEVPDPDTGGETSIYVCVIDANDRKEFPELRHVYAVTLWETDQGFVHHKWFPSKTAYEKAKKNVEAELERDQRVASRPGREHDGEDFEGLGDCSGTVICRKG